MTRGLAPGLAALMDAAASAAEAGDVERAEPLFQRIVAENPGDAEAWHMLAIIALRRGQAAEAIDLATKALQLHRRSHIYLNTLGIAHAEAQQLAEAQSCLKRALKVRPDYAEAHYNLGKVYSKLGDLPDAERCYLRARRLDPGKAEVANNLAALYSRQGRYTDALPLLAEASAGLPDDESVAINTGIALLATSGPEAAIAHLQSYLSRHPGAAAVHAELGRRLLAQGHYVEGWREYAWRSGSRAGRSLGRRVLLLPDQGLGDHLFFLRFAGALRQRAAHVAFKCPDKLLALLAARPPADELCRGGCDERDFDAVLPLGDLPLALGDAGTPPPLPITVEPSHIAPWRERLAALGPAPYLAVTWRGGSTREGQSEFAARGEDPLHKEIDVGALASAIRAWRGTILILQRQPAQAEIDAFRKALGRAAHDLSTVNENLLDAATVLSVVDDYVAVSNTNVHLCASLAKPARVLVPFPPEFRWMHTGDSSPWFPGFRIYRQSSGHGWEPALERLGFDLSV